MLAISPLNLRISLLLIAPLLSTTHGLCSLIPCFYQQPPNPQVLNLPAYPRLNSIGYPSYTYPTYNDQTAPLVPLVFYFNSQANQPSAGNAWPGRNEINNSEKPHSAVQILSPLSSGAYSQPPTSYIGYSGASSPTNNVLPDTNQWSTKPSAPTSISSFLTTVLQNVVSRPNLSSSSENLSSVKPSLPPNDSSLSNAGSRPNLPSSGESPSSVKPSLSPSNISNLPVAIVGGVTPQDTAGHRSDDSSSPSGNSNLVDGGVSPQEASKLQFTTWRLKWLRPVVNTDQPKLCQMTSAEGDDDKTHHGCLTTCQSAYNTKLASIGLTKTGVIFLGGSCQTEEGQQESVCKCFVRLGPRYDNFTVTNQK